MKKIILPILALMVLAVTTSCERDESRTFSTNVVIKANNWVTSDQVNYYFATVRWNALSEEVVYNGQVHAYIYEDGRQNPLPYIIPVTYTHTTTDTAGVTTSETITVPENLRFDYEPGQITFIIDDLDGKAPEDMVNISDYTIRICAVLP
ncbi:MAG: hypothetical protein IJ789_01765 [Bacteroidales bacterium]|nr:hypothetical protein [Bacteroidales bacterium]